MNHHLIPLISILLGLLAWQPPMASGADGVVKVDNGPSYRFLGQPRGLNPVEHFGLHYPDLSALLESEPRARRVLDEVLAATRAHKDVYPVDPLLVLALIKQESSYQSTVVSSMGAAGLMQFVPSTGRLMGLEPIYKPEMYKEGRGAHLRSARLLSQAEEAMKERQFETMERKLDGWETAQKEADQLLSSYQDELQSMAENREPDKRAEVDGRFSDRRAIQAGTRYLARMMARRDGDIREALAAYNAGPGMVRRVEGIPAIEETVHYQNRIVNTYRRYRSLAGAPGESDS